MKVCSQFKHDERVIYDGTENYTTSIRWCSRCGAVKHPTRLKNGDLSKRLYWHFPRNARTGIEVTQPINRKF